MNIVHGAVPKEKKYAVDELINIMRSHEGGINTRVFSVEDIFFAGYPLLRLPEGTLSLDSLILSKGSGIIAIDIICDPDKISMEEAMERQDNCLSPPSWIL